jgi:hypothetical protein
VVIDETAKKVVWSGEQYTHRIVRSQKNFELKIQKLSQVRFRHVAKGYFRPGVWGRHLASAPNPALPPRSGSWVGHLTQFEGWQNKLINLIAEADAKGCPVPPEARELAKLPTPRRPTWK